MNTRAAKQKRSARDETFGDSFVTVRRKTEQVPTGADYTRACRNALFDFVTSEPGFSHVMVTLGDGQKEMCCVHKVLRELCEKLRGYTPEKFNFEVSVDGRTRDCASEVPASAIRQAAEKYSILSSSESSSLDASALIVEFLADAKIALVFPELSSFLARAAEQVKFQHADSERVVLSSIDRTKCTPLQLQRMKKYELHEHYKGAHFEVFSWTRNAGVSRVDVDFMYALAILTIKSDAPSAWMPLVAINADRNSFPSLCFARPPHCEALWKYSSDVVTSKTVVGSVFGRFCRFTSGFYKDNSFPWNDADNLISCSEVGEVSLQMPARSLEITQQRCMQFATMARDYIERTEAVEDFLDVDYMIDETTGSARTLAVMTGFLFTPASIYVDAFGKLYHLPLLGGANEHHDFVPRYVAFLPRTAQQRAAILFSLARMVYMLFFTRSIDEDFVKGSAANSVEEWCSEVSARKFQQRDAFNRHTPIALINWLMLCMTNRISTGDINAHTFFACAHEHSLSVPFGKVRLVLQCERFQSLWSPIKRITDEPVVFKIADVENTSRAKKLAYVTEYATRMLAHANLAFEDKLAISDKDLADLCLATHLSQALEITFNGMAYDMNTAMNLHFQYAEQKAVGLGVWREIVMRCFEGIKHWDLFEFNAEEAMLDYSPRNQLDLWLRFHRQHTLLYALIYWCLYNDVRVPYLLSPSILAGLFNESLLRNAGHVVDIWCARKYDYATRLLDTLDDNNAEAFELVGATGKTTALKELYSASVHSVRQTSHVFDISIIPGAFRVLRSIVQASFADAESLVFLLCHQTYGPDGGAIPVTAEIVISVLDTRRLAGNISSLTGIDLSNASIAATSQTVAQCFPDAAERTLYNYLCLIHSLAESSSVKETTTNCMRILYAARVQTYLYLLRWIALASREKLAKFWKMLHGFSTTVLTGLLIDSSYKLPDRFVDLLVDADKCEANGNPLETLVYKKTSRLRYFGRNFSLHKPSPRHAITLYFRDPISEDRNLFSPQYASCTATLSLSICHETYEAFAMSMDASLATPDGSGNNFTLNG